MLFLLQIMVCRQIHSKPKAQTAAEKLVARQDETGTLTNSIFTQQIKDAAEKFNVPAVLIDAVIKKESTFNPKAYNKTSGATGLMQLTPGTAKELGVTNAWDPTQNIMGGTKYLKQMLRSIWRGYSQSTCSL